MLIIDAHLDLSMNAMEWNRDLTRPVSEIRQSEKGLTDKPDRGKGMVSLPALREAGIGLVVATQIARYAQPADGRPGWHSPQQAWAQTQGQLGWYWTMEATGQMRQISCTDELDAHLEEWANADNRQTLPVGYILSLEGADSIISPQWLERAWEEGLRAVGPAHYGPGRYANGTNSTGRMTEAGIDLLQKMESLNIILDATHLCDDAFWQALEQFDGPVWASHNNCRALVDHNRQFSDDQIRALLQRGAVIGAAMDAWMIVPGWQRGVSSAEGMQCNLYKLVDHIDHICQLAGNTLHVMMGTDLDGAFGKEQCPYDLESIAELPKMADVLAERGYAAADIENIMHGNFLRFIRRAWKRQ